MYKWFLGGFIMLCGFILLQDERFTPSRKLFRIYTDDEKMWGTGFTLHSIIQYCDLKQKSFPKNNQEILNLVEQAGYQDQTLLDILKLDTIKSRIHNDSSVVVYSIGPDGIDDRADTYIDLRSEKVTYKEYLTMKGDLILGIFVLDSWRFK
jgi:hypothetical protein